MAEHHQIGKFILLRELPETPLGRNFRAAEMAPTSLKKIVYLTRLIDNVTTEINFQKNLQAKFLVLQSKGHVNISKPYEVNNLNGVFISQELIEGFNIKNILKRCSKTNLPFSIDYALFTAERICQALDFASGLSVEGKPLTHGGITPYNVYLNFDGEVKINDWTICSSADKMKTTRNIFLERFQLYLSPEQAAGRPASPASDVFQVGLLLYEMLTGLPLYSKNRQDEAEEKVRDLTNFTREIDSKTIPEDIINVLAKALAEDPAKRYARPEKLREALDSILYSGNYLATTTKTSFLMNSIFKSEIKTMKETLAKEKSADYSEYIGKMAEITTGAKDELSAEEIASMMLPNVGEVEVEEEPDLDLGTDIIGYTKTKKPPIIPIVAGALVVFIVLIIIIFSGGKGESTDDMMNIETPEMMALRKQASDAEKRLQELRDKATKDEAEKISKEEELKKLQTDQQRIQDEMKRLRDAEQKRLADDKAEQDRIAAEKKAREDQIKSAEDERLRQIELAKQMEKATAQPTILPTGTTGTGTAATTGAVPATTLTIEESQIVQGNDPDIKLELVTRVDPKYPRTLRRAGMTKTGTVRVLLLIGLDGKVESAQVLSGDPAFADEAVKAAEQWVYKPVTKKGAKVKVSTVIAMKF